MNILNSKDCLNNMNVIDSRDLHDRLEELENQHNEYLAAEDEVERLKDLVKENDSEKNLSDLEDAISDFDALIPLDQDEIKELEELQTMRDDVTDWEYGATLINEGHFVKYCQELCEDVGDIPKGLPWYIANAIDWEQVASYMEQDYSEVTYQGETYYYNS